jgi:hypothetical protein
VQYTSTPWEKFKLQMEGKCKVDGNLRLALKECSYKRIQSSMIWPTSLNIIEHIYLIAGVLQSSPKPKQLITQATHLKNLKSNCRNALFK